MFHVLTVQASVVRLAAALACVAATIIATDHARAEPAKRAPAALTVELNRALSAGANCRLALVAHNGLAVAIKALTMEVVLFDKQRQVVSVLSVAAGEMPAGKTRVRQYDIKAVECASIGQVLLNDVTRCDGQGLTPAACLKLVKPSSRTSIPFTF